MLDMQNLGRPILTSDFTLTIFDEHYGFADFDYRTAAGTQTQTDLFLGGAQVPMPMRAAYCVAATVILPALLIAAAILFLKYRRRPA